jgi:hypothetical protein
MLATNTIGTVLDFWFGGEPDMWRPDPWFHKSGTFDADIAARFGVTVKAAQGGGLDQWASTPKGTLALLLVLDQFARNIHRGSALAFASDAHARHIAHVALAGGIEAALTPVQRVFVYLPFEHAESMADQDVSVRLFTALPASDWRDSVVDYAERHREVIRRFGRFPHRNLALGRASTEDEATYLAEGGGF